MVEVITDRLVIKSNDMVSYKAYLNYLDTFPFDDPTYELSEFVTMFIELEERGMIVNPLWSYPWTVSCDNIPVGIIGFKGIPVDSIAEIGYSLLTEHRGIGYATEMVKAMIKWSKSQGIGTLEAKTALDNDASINVLKKCGFEFERVIEKKSLKEDDPERVMNLFILKM